MFALYARSQSRVLLTCARHLNVRAYSEARKEPLRILFCGSDDFSAASLNRLHAEQVKDKDFIASIDVVCKAGKPFGRGKTIREVPLKQIASALNLPVHEISTFTNWELPPGRQSQGPINMIIAVSFGLLVPERLLKGVKYGGLNVHASLLPRLRGPAPLQHTLYQGSRTSGITVQTLHPKHFDQGLLLAQAPFELPSEGKCTHEELVDYVKPLAADLLVDTLRKDLYRDPVSIVSPESDNASHAPKMNRDDARVDWSSWSTDRVLRMQRANAPLWNCIQDFAEYEESTYKGIKDLRIQWHGLKVADVATDAPRQAGTLETYEDNCEASDVKGPRVSGVWTCNGNFLGAESLTISGRRKHQEASTAIGILNKALHST